MTTKELIVQEMETVPEPLLVEVLDFLQFLKAKRTQNSEQAGSKRVTVVSAAGEVSVPLELLAAQNPQVAQYMKARSVPVNQMHDELQQALAQSGYHSKEDIVSLVQEVKKEMLAERDAQRKAYDT